MQTLIIGLAHELSMKTPNCVKTGLTPAFRVQGVDRGSPWKDLRRRNLGKSVSLSGNSTNCGQQARGGLPRA
jgi:hypothetical protein